MALPLPTSLTAASCALLALLAACGGDTKRDVDVQLYATLFCIRCFGTENRFPSGSLVRLQYYARNAGSESSDRVQFEVGLPPNLALSSVTCTASSAGVHTGDRACSLSGPASFLGPSIAPDEVLNVTLEVAEKQSASFSAAVTLSALEPNDKESGNNAAASPEFLLYRADLAVSYRVPPSTPASQFALFELVVTNNGPDPTYWTQSQGEVTFSDGSQPQGRVLSGEFPGFTGHYLQPSQSITIGYEVAKPASGASTVSSTYTLLSKSSDSNRVNDSATAATTFVGP